MCDDTKENVLTDPLKALTREERIWIATKFFGLYVLGNAMTESEKIDEDCGMDNMGVPRYHKNLKPEYMLWLEFLHEPGSLKKIMPNEFVNNEITGHVDAIKHDKLKEDFNDSY